MNKEKQREQLHRLLDVVLDCNGIEERKKEKTGNLPTMFFKFSGHVNCVTVDLCVNGWGLGEIVDRTWFLDIPDALTDEKIDEIRAAAEAALEKGE